MINKCFGFISWLPDNKENRKARIERLNNAFKQIIDLFGEDSEFLIIAQNWGDYKVPSFIKHSDIFKYGKLGILGARKKLREHFLESNYDYLIMCDDDIVLKTNDDNTINEFNKALEDNPKGFWFPMYGWSLSFCAVSKWIYEREEMVDVDPEKSEGYEDTVFPYLLHYKYPKHEFKFDKLKFLQYQAKYHKDHKSTWAGIKGKKIDYRALEEKSRLYKEEFEKGNYDVLHIKENISANWEKIKQEERKRKQAENPDLPLLDDCLDLYGY